MIEELFQTLFGDIIWELVRRLGATVRWIFLQKKYSYREVLEQDWNGRVGILMVLLTIVITIVALV